MSMPARLLAGRSVAVVGAMVLGIGALMLFAWSAQGWLRVVIVLALFGIGMAVNGNRNDFGTDPVTHALGDDVKIGIGASATFLGAYLVGPLILSFTDAQPGAVVVILLIYGFPLLALLRFVSREMRVGMIGAALLVLVLGTVLLAQAGLSSTVVAIIEIVVAVATFALVIIMPKNWELTQPISVFGAMAASFAVGAGTSAVGSLTAQQQNESTSSPVPTLPPAPQVVVLALGLLVAAGFLLVALARHHAASGVVAGSVFAVPPTSVLVSYFYGAHESTAALAVLIAVPVIAAVLAALALYVPDARRALRTVLPPHLRPARPVVGATMLRATIGIALLVIAEVVPLLGHGYRTQGVIVVVLLAIATWLAWWLPSTSGAVLAGAVLVELGIDTPWWRLAADWGSRNPGATVVPVIGVLVTGAVAALLLRRHPRPGVFAAAAYALAGALSAVLYVVGGSVAISWVVGPLALLGIPAAVVALRGRPAAVAAAQAVGCVVLAVGGLSLARLALPALGRTSNVVYDVALAPLTPTLTGAGSAPSAQQVAMIALAMVVIAVPLLVSVVRRPLMPLAACGVLLTVESAAAGVLAVAEAWSESGVNTTIFAMLIIGAVGCAGAYALLARRDAGVGPQDARTPTAP